MLGCSSSDLDSALKAQVEAKLVDIQYEHGQALYSLTRDALGRRPVLALVVLQ
jgi:hypothetical protein